jgi:hypothetical protein
MNISKESQFQILQGTKIILRKKDFLPKKKIGVMYALHKQLDNKWRDQIMDLAHAVVPLY